MPPQGGGCCAGARQPAPAAATEGVRGGCHPAGLGSPHPAGAALAARQQATVTCFMWGVAVVRWVVVCRASGVSNAGEVVRGGGVGAGAVRGGGGVSGGSIDFDALRRETSSAKAQLAAAAAAAAKDE